MTQIRISPNPIFLLFILAIALTACREKSKQELIIGNWKLVVDSVKYDPEQDPPPAPFAIPGRGISYTFLNDTIVDTRQPYYRIVRQKGRGSREIRFIGTKTNYKIAYDSLKIYDLTDSVWGSAKKITRLTNDTLILTKKDGQRLVFLRHNYDLDDKPLFDRISLSSSGCYGTCAVLNMIIDSTGGVIYHGEMYVDKIGYYEGQIPKESFLDIEREFRKANIGSLNEEYSASWTDDETISTTFCSQNQVIKSIQDYGRTGPDELIWAYQSLRYVFQDLDLKKIDSTKMRPYLNLRFFNFEKGDEVSRLNQSESFLLWNYLRNGTVVERPIDKTYKLNFGTTYSWDPSTDEVEELDQQVSRVDSDGRYYTFALFGRKPITIDIGFNYLLVNNRLENFHKKKVYE